MGVFDDQVTVDINRHSDLEGDQKYKLNLRIGSRMWLDFCAPVKSPIPHDLAGLEIWEE